MSMTTTAERKYALTKIKAQDYLLPSNDASTIWRLTTYTEGPSSGIEGMDRDETFWGVWKWLNPQPWSDTPPAVDPYDWSQWDFCEGWCRTRAEAIDTALRMAA